MLLPLWTDRDLRDTPWATFSLIALNVLVTFIAWMNPTVFEAFILDPGAFGWWQPLTAMFTHLDIMHLLGNMLVLWLFGAHVEDVLGVKKFLLVYFTCGFAADVLQVAADAAFLGDARGSLGASGAIMGMVSFFATRFKYVKIHFVYWILYRAGSFDVEARWVALGYFAGDMIQGLGTGLLGVPSMVGNFAHVGGFLAGLVWIYALRENVAIAREAARAEAGRLAACGVYSGAAAYLEERSRKWPDDPEVSRMIATYYSMKSGGVAQARPHWEKAVRLFLTVGRREDAFHCWGRVLADARHLHFPLDLYFDVGVALEQAGKYDSAADTFTLGYRIHPSAPATPKLLLRLADMQARLGDTDSARAHYQHIITTWPDALEAVDAASHQNRVS